TSPAVYTSPVPKYIICWLLGSTVMDITAKFPGTPATRCQTEEGLVISSLTQRPPLTPPANTLVVLPGAKIREWVLPPTLLGPRSSHRLVASPGAFIAVLVFNSCWRL